MGVKVLLPGFVKFNKDQFLEPNFSKIWRRQKKVMWIEPTCKNDPKIEPKSAQNCRKETILGVASRICKFQKALLKIEPIGNK